MGRGNEGKNPVLGSVFDIRRFSVHDGSGIRTTLFLKGCPLSCVWCHNPEGISGRRRPVYFPNRCIRCGICCAMAVCEGVRMAPDGIRLSPFAEEDWDGIMEACPSNALKWDARIMTAEEAVEEAMKDAPFFRHGGGVTLSGGEPLCQPEFTAQALQKLKERGVHTAIETALFVKPEVLQMVLPYLDFIYADFKIYDENSHMKFTGGSNEVIKENIKYLLESEKRDSVTIRTPMIPELTATVENVAAISSYISGIYPQVKYELLNYNPLAKAKYDLVGREYYFRNSMDRFTLEVMDRFADTAMKNRIKNMIWERT